MKYSLMPERGTIDAVFIFRRLQYEYDAKGRNFSVFFVVLVKAFYRVPRKVLEWAMRKKGMPEVLVRSVMSLYEGAKMRVRLDSELSEEFEVKVGMYQGSVLSPFLHAAGVDVVTEFAREGVLCELLNADDLVLMSVAIEGLGNNFLNWKEVFESKGLKVILEITKVTVSGDITKDGLFEGKVDPCGVCSL